MTTHDDLRARLLREADAHDYFASNPDLRMTTGDHAARAQKLRDIAAANTGGEVKCFRPMLQKSGQASKGYIAVMTAKPDPRDSDWRGEDSRQRVAFTDYAALQTDVARLRAALDCAAVNLGMEQLAREAAEAKLRKAEPKARRYDWLKDNGIIRVLPIASGMMSRGGTRILADSPSWLPGDFTYVIDGVTVDVDAAIDAAITGAAAYDPSTPTPESSA